MQSSAAQEYASESLKGMSRSWPTWQHARQLWHTDCLTSDDMHAASCAVVNGKSFKSLWVSCRQQDEELDQLGEHVERLGGLGKEIHGELESQSR